MPGDRKRDVLTPTDHAEAIAIFRSQIIGVLGRRELDHGELRAVFVELSEQRFRPPSSDVMRCFSIPTLERWHYAYRQGGLTALRPKARSDRGRAHELRPEQRALLLDIRREHPSASVPLILRTLIGDGRLDAGAISEATVRRFFVEHGLDRVSIRNGAGPTTRLRWQAERPGALWQGDVCHGASITVQGTTRPLRIHALLDDASRYVVALEAHHSEREVDMLGLFVRALRRHGAPDALYLDNGSTYRGETLRLGCERLNIQLLHARPYDAPARGKMERFWRTLREGCLDFLGDLASLADVQARLTAFLDEHYHLAPHGSLMGKSPFYVFSQPRGQVDSLTEEMLATALTVREKRRVRKDTTVSIEGTDFELDQGFLAGRIVVVARNLVEAGIPPWVEYEGKRLTLRPVDPIKNARRKRLPKKPIPASPKAAVVFDPPGTLLKRAQLRSKDTARLKAKDTSDLKHPSVPKEIK